MNPLIANASRVPSPLAPPVDAGAAPALNLSQYMAPQTPQLMAQPLPNVGVSQTLTDVDKLHALQAQGSGVSQIHNPWLRGAARVVDTIGQVLAPNVERLIPKTEGHYRDDLARQSGVVDQDQQIEQNQARVAQERALATQETAKAQELMNPPKKVTPGHLVVAQDGSAAGYQDADGTLKPLDDPSVPQGVRSVAANMAGKPTKTPLSETPLDEAEAKRLNGLWDGLADKHHLPKGQFVPGMTRADATTLAAGLNNVVGKQQGDTHVSISMQGLQNQENKNAPPNINDPATQAVIDSVGTGKVKLGEVFGRGATTAQKAQFVAAVQSKYPNYNSGDHDIENHLRNYMIAGKGGQTLTAFNTAQTHLDILRQASDALQNGDVTLFNSIGQQFSKATGNPAPTDFNAVKNAVKGEVARALTGNVTVSEQSELDKDFNNASSPRQIAGVAKKYMQLIEGKKGAMRDTYTAGQQGQVNFGTSGQSATPVATHRYNPKTGKIEAQ